MKVEDKTRIEKAREYKVVKANEIIQKARFELSVVEQRTISYVISMIKPDDKHLREYEFDIQEYCKICGIDYDNGGNYGYIKSVIKGLSDRSLWVELDDGTETLCRWVNKAWTNKRSGKARIRLDDDIQKYLINVSGKFTQYELYNTLNMKSQYSFRLYELFKSHAFKKKETFEIDDLKRKLSAENYERFPDFRRKVLEISLREINEFTDIYVSYDTITKGRKVVKIIFFIREKDIINKYGAYRRAIDCLDGENKEIDGQAKIDNFIGEDRYE